MYQVLRLHQYCVKMQRWGTFSLGAVFMMLVVTSREGSESKTTDCIASRAFEGQPADIMCRFPEDVNIHKQHLQVLRYDFDDWQDVPELVLACDWLYNNDAHTCTTGRDYEFVEPLGHEARIKILNVTKRNEGFYHCQYGIPFRWNVQKCSLRIREKEIKCTGASVWEGDPASVTCHYNSDLSKTRDDFLVYHRRFGETRFGKFVACALDSTKSYCYHYSHGYALNEGAISRDVTIHIPAAQKSHAGVYACDTIPSSYVKLTRCSLHVHKKEIKCTGASVFEGDPANVTCHFTSVLRKTQNNFTVYHRRFGESRFGEVVRCAWRNNKTECSSTPHGYVLREIAVSPHVTIHIPAAQKSHAGVYNCNTIPPSNVTTTPCSLHVHERRTTRKEITVMSTVHEKKTATTTTTTTTTKSFENILHREKPGDNEDIGASSETERADTLTIMIAGTLGFFSSSFP